MTAHQPQPAMRTLEDVSEAQASLAKLRRATEHAVELNRTIEAWAERADPHPVGSIATDRLSWEVRLSLAAPPPVEQISLIFGDAMHNIRSSLDALVWAFCAPEMLGEMAQTRLGFPICRIAKQWQSQQGQKLATVPDDVVERIKHCQPFNLAGNEPAAAALVGLADLDNHDKHRLAIRTLTDLPRMEASSQVEFETEEAAARNAPPDNTVHVAPLSDGVLLMSGRTVDPIRKIAGTVQVDYHFLAETKRGVVDILWFIQEIQHHVLQIIAYICDAIPKGYVLAEATRG